VIPLKPRSSARFRPSSPPSPPATAVPEPASVPGCQLAYAAPEDTARVASIATPIALRRSLIRPVLTLVIPSHLVVAATWQQLNDQPDET
jgi:hypothetical protein